jgi:hypothetical protein
MSSSYKIVFRLELLHEYFADEAAKHLSVIPSEATSQLLRNHELKWKQSGNFLLVAAKTDSTGKPVKPWTPETKFVFYVLSENGLFQNITNPSPTPSAKNTYWLSNFSGNEMEEPVSGGGNISRLHLSKPIATHVSATVYQPGRLVIDGGTDELYECLKTTTGGTLLSNTSFWRKRGKKQYITTADTETIVSSQLLFAVSSPATVFQIRWLGLTASNGTMNTELRAAEIQKFETATNKISVSLHKIPAGRCRIEVNGESVIVVVKDTSLVSTPVAVVELMSDVGTNADFSLLNAGVVADKRFTVRFCNKSVLWKYVAKTNDVTAINDSSSTLSFTNTLSPREFLSTAPYPLKEQPIKTISFTSAVLGSVNSLSNASPSFLSEMEVDGDVFSCSSIYLNH